MCNKLQLFILLNNLKGKLVTYSYNRKTQVTICLDSSLSHNFLTECLMVVLMVVVRYKERDSNAFCLIYSVKVPYCNFNRNMLNCCVKGFLNYNIFVVFKNLLAKAGTYFYSRVAQVTICLDSSLSRNCLTKCLTSILMIGAHDGKRDCNALGLLY